MVLLPASGKNLRGLARSFNRASPKAVVRYRDPQPPAARRLVCRLDPALMSNPFVAGISDILAIVIYMSVAVLLLR